MALSNQISAAASETAETVVGNDNKKERGRPKGSGIPRVRTCKFDLTTGVDAMADLACRTDHGWGWDGKSYPKTKRSHGPNQDSLETHAEPLKLLLGLAPNGYPDP